MVFPRGRRLKRRKGVYFARRLREEVSEYSRGRRSVAQVSAMVRGWISHVSHGRTLGLRRAVLRQVRLVRR